MTVHRITLPDVMRGHERRTIVWDDEAGTVDGDHFDVRQLREDLAKPTPLVIPGPIGSKTLRDPAHDPGDFKALLSTVMGCPGAWSYDDLPEPLRSAETPDWDEHPFARDALA
ncbi:MAG: hypothetical protein OXP11_12715 [Gammaproteobacteria bacterium]|nr:hypothetical protein [Gammaproteobacteria bacterium]